MSNGKFVRGTTFTFGSSVLSLLINLGISVLLARVLGPEGKGIYAMALLLPALIVIFGSLGIGPATVYYVARGEFKRPQILGNNILFSAGVGIAGVLAGLVVVLFFRDTIFPGVALCYLLLALVFIPAEAFFSYVRSVLLGAQRIKEFNYAQMAHSALLLGFIAFALLGLKTGVSGAILAGLFAWLFVDVLVFRQAKTIAEGVEFTPNTTYIKQAATYGIQAHFFNVLTFLNYRVDMFLVNGFLGPGAVGIYALGVGLGEKLWMVSQSAGTVIFPRVSAETEGKRDKEFTPLVARTVLWITALGALIMALISHWAVLLLYSEAFLPAVGVLQALLVGIVMLSAWRVLANDIAGRGFPTLNTYTSVIAVVANIGLNLLWIPQYGIIGAAWASTVSYTVSFIMVIFFFCRISGNRWTKVIFPQQGDLTRYLLTAKTFAKLIVSRVKNQSNSG